MNTPPFSDQSLPPTPIHHATPLSQGSGVGTSEGLLLPQSSLYRDRASTFSVQASEKIRSTRRRPFLLWAAGAAGVVLIAVAIFVPVYFLAIKNRSQHNSKSTPGNNSGSTGDGHGSDSRAITGGDGSTILTDDGSTFTYHNNFGGFWIDDPNDPFNDNARPNSWTPPLNTTWNFERDHFAGVNLGGLFVLEPFITPTFYQKYADAVDEWTLSELMAADTASGGLKQLEDHYNTFITEKDIAQIVGAGLNAVRLPIPFWAIETWPGEPFLAKTSWKYILRIIGWCRKYGLRVNIDLHTVPGSQNGYNHSGRSKSINWLNGPMGIANAQRSLEYIRVFIEFFSQPQYSNIVFIFGIVNEPTVDRDPLNSFYFEAHRMIREITGVGEGKGPVISIWDNSYLQGWTDSTYFAGADRIAVESHPYFAFGDKPSTAPIDTGTGQGAGGTWPDTVCSNWAPMFNNTRTTFGITYAGEISNAINDCGLMVRGKNPAIFPGNCADYSDSSKWTDGMKAGLRQFLLASMDAIGDYFFWTWKIGNSTAGKVEAPLWSYQLGLENGWIPADPREAVGFCAARGMAGPSFAGYKPYQTGGVGAGTLAQTYPWPPTSIASAGALIPMYTPTGTIVSLPPQTFTPKPNGLKPSRSVDAGDGWYNSQDNAGAPTPVAGCQYPPDAWDAIGATVGTGCGAVRVATAANIVTSSSTSTLVPTVALPAGVTTTATTPVPVAPATVAASAA